MGRKKKTEASRRAARPGFGEAVKTLRENRGWSLDHLAELSGVDASTISLIERGKRNPSVDKSLPGLAEAFEMRESELIAFAEECAGRIAIQRRIPVVARMGYDPIRLDPKTAALGTIRKHRIVNYSALSDENGYAVEITDVSMEPRYKRGETILVSTEIVCSSGSDVMLYRNNGMVYLRIYYEPVDQTRCFVLASHNPSFPPECLKRGEIDEMHRIVGAWHPDLERKPVKPEY